MASILSEFDEIGYREMVHEEGWEEGREYGREEGLKEGLKEERENSIQTLVEFAQECSFAQDKTAQQLVKRYQLSKEEAISYVEKYWKK